MVKLQGKSALVTGAGSGIGQAIAQLFAAEGACVLVTDVNAETAEQTARTIVEAGGTAHGAHLDVTSEAEVQRVVERAVETFGRLDLLLNVAGTGSTQTVIDTELETWERVMAVNATGTFLMCKYALPFMIRQGGGVVINIASAAGLIGLPLRAAYCASKGAVISLTKAMALDHVSQGIRVNAICPGTVDSPWVGRLLQQADDPATARERLVQRQPMGRLGTPEEIAYAALYLASDEAGFVTGTALIIDGGLTAG